MEGDGTRPLERETVLAGACEHRLHELLHDGRRQWHQAEAMLFQQGEHAGSIVLLERGCVKVTHVSEEGRESLLAVRGPGDVLGELAVLNEGPRSATVTALEPVVSLSLSAVAFRSAVASDGRLGMAVLRVLNGRLREADRTRVEFAALDASARLALRLIELSCRYGQSSADGTRTCSALTQDELAAWVGSSREAVAKALRTFRDQGWITSGRRRITVLDEGALRRHVERRQRP